MVSDLTDLERVPFPTPVAVIIRSGLAGLLSGVGIALVLWVLYLEATADVLVAALTIGTVVGVPFGLALGVVMAVWFTVTAPKRSTVRLAITGLSVALAALLFAVLFASAAVFFWFVPVLVGIVSWFALPRVLRPAENPDRR